MKYALRITRDTGSNAVAVHPVIRVRDTVKPYRLKYASGDLSRYAESLRLFDTRQEAETAFREETAAAEFTTKTPEELDAILHADLAELKREGFPLSQICRLTDANADTVQSYRCRYNPPNPRLVAKIHLLLPLVREFQERARALLPLREGAGGTGLARPYPRAKKYKLD